MPELKPCPFCGGVADIRMNKSHKGGQHAVLVCGGCGLRRYADTMKDMIIWWEERK